MSSHYQLQRASLASKNDRGHPSDRPRLVPSVVRTTHIHEHPYFTQCIRQFKTIIIKHKKNFGCLHENQNHLKFLYADNKPDLNAQKIMSKLWENIKGDDKNRWLPNPSYLVLQNPIADSDAPNIFLAAIELLEEHYYAKKVPVFVLVRDAIFNR